MKTVNIREFGFSALSPALPPAQLRKLEAFMEREGAVLDRCGTK